MRRFNLRTIEKVARNQEYVCGFCDCSIGNKRKHPGNIFVRQPAVESATAKVYVCGVKQLNGDD